MQNLYYDDKPLTSSGGIVYKGGPIGRDEFIKASSEDRLIGLVKKHMEEYLQHFIECDYRPCYWIIYKSILIPHLDDVNVVKKVLKSDAIILKDSPHSEYTVHVEPLEIRESPAPTECMKLYPELYYHLKDVESKEVKLFIENLWSTMVPVRI